MKDTVFETYRGVDISLSHGPRRMALIKGAIDNVHAIPSQNLSELQAYLEDLSNPEEARHLAYKKGKEGLAALTADIVGLDFARFD